MNIHFKNEGQDCKTGSFRERAVVGGWRVNGKGEGERTRSIYFIYLCENRTMKQGEIILSVYAGEGDEGQLWRR
jgi:hypothetical protein